MHHESLHELNEKMRLFEIRNDFARAAFLWMRHPDDMSGALREGEAKFSSRPGLLKVLMAAVAAGGTGTAGWASEINWRTVSAEWVSILSSRTLIGLLPFRKVDAWTRTLVESAPASATWVMDGGPIPISKMILAAAVLEAYGIKGICIFTNEQINTWSSALASNINNSLLRALSRAMDAALLDPDIAAVAGKNPASLTNGIVATPSTGATAAAVATDLQALLQHHIDAGADLLDVVLVMSPVTALHIAALYTAGGARAFPNVNVKGGEVYGVPVFTSVGAKYAGSPSANVIAAINAPAILVADSGEIELLASRAASVQQSDSPGAGDQPQVSMLQANATALRFSRRLDFRRASADAVSWMATSY